jgi:hypothetical protein
MYFNIILPLTLIFSSDIPTKILLLFLISTMRTTCPSEGKYTTNKEKFLILKKGLFYFAIRSYLMYCF